MLETPTAAFARAGARLLQAYPQAVDALVALLTDPAASPPVRLRAATAIARHAEAVYHEQQVVHRLDVLEEDVHGGRAPRATLEEACARLETRVEAQHDAALVPLEREARRHLPVADAQRYRQLLRQAQGEVGRFDPLRHLTEDELRELQALDARLRDLVSPPPELPDVAAILATLPAAALTDDEADADARPGLQGFERWVWQPRYPDRPLLEALEAHPVLARRLDACRRQLKNVSNPPR